MESFEIQLLEERFTVEPLANGIYRIIQGDFKIGAIYAQADGDRLKWESQDSLEEGFVQQLGELIAEHNM